MRALALSAGPLFCLASACSEPPVCREALDRYQAAAAERNDPHHLASDFDEVLGLVEQAGRGKTCDEAREIGTRIRQTREAHREQRKAALAACRSRCDGERRDCIARCGCTVQAGGSIDCRRDGPPKRGAPDPQVCARRCDAAECGRRCDEEDRRAAEPPRRHDEAAPESPAKAPEVLSGDGPIDLRGPPRGEGSLRTYDSEISIPQGEFKKMPNEQIGLASVKIVARRQVEVVEADAQGPRVVEERILWERVELYLDGKKSEYTTPLHGEIVVATRQKGPPKTGRFVRTLVGKTPTPEQQIELSREPDYLAEHHPARPVRIGESWSVPPDELRRAVGAAPGENVRGLLRYTLRQLERCGSGRCARLELVRKIEASGQRRPAWSSDVRGELLRAFDPEHADFESRAKGRLRLVIPIEAGEEQGLLSIEGEGTHVVKRL